MMSVKCVQESEQRRKRGGHCTLSSSPPAGHGNDGTHRRKGGNFFLVDVTGGDPHPRHLPHTRASYAGVPARGAAHPLHEKETFP
ncbi:hypothetical protein E2C01_070095 [Portunus trituberculatus]|uniref:Uncharacterized protein n=1 Tax=Portunus trituberculatus TaxID=210409 RepID=A0A5B7I0E8_PORTR|nr:hypothetical protein [Portunus trituberculatus]